VLGHFAKSDIRYWHQAIFRQTYTRNGQTLVTKDWAMKIAHEGRRETFPLGTPNKAAAAARVATTEWFPDAATASLLRSRQACLGVHAKTKCFL
jgi:hypothetical protein